MICQYEFLKREYTEHKKKDQTHFINNKITITYIKPNNKKFFNLYFFYTSFVKSRD